MILGARHQDRAGVLSEGAGILSAWIWEVIPAAENDAVLLLHGTVGSSVQVGLRVCMRAAAGRRRGPWATNWVGWYSVRFDKSFQQWHESRP